jgi:antitoxin component YwqK of YwqJK toxin-antitoxin module
MDKRTKFKVTVITIVGVLVAFIYINRGQLIREFKFAQSEIEWQKEEPKGQLLDGRKNGEWMTYFKNGQIARLDNYKNDTLHGRQIWYTPDGQYNLRANYNMGIKVDSFFMYDGKGRLNLVEFSDSTGKQQGPFIVYNTNGQIIQAGNYRDGKFDGEFKTFFRTGQLKAIEHYKLSERFGKWIELSDKGDTIKVERY